VPVVAASFGGLASLGLALRAPERVAALVLLGSDLDEFAESDELAAFFAEEQAALDAGDVTAAVEANVRTWVTRGGRDVDPAVVDVEDFIRLGERLAGELPGAGPLVRIAGAAHLPALERPDEVAALVLGFLAALPPADR